MQQPKLLAVGGGYVDINAPQFPFDDQGMSIEAEYVGSGYQLEPGGAAVNFARLCASLGLPAAFIGKVGDDTMGHILSDLLTKGGVTPRLVFDNTVSTNVSFNMVNAHGKSIMAVAGNANQALRADEVNDQTSALFSATDYLFIGGCFKLKSLLPAFEQLVAQAKESNTKIILDHSRINSGVTENEKQIVRNLALAADYYLPSKDEFLELWSVSSIEEGLKQLSTKSSGIIIVKDSENGAITIVDGQVRTIPAFPVQPIHIIGAGDSFDAGFIAATSQGKDVLSAIRFGCATAALKISQPSLPTAASIEKFIN